MKKTIALEIKATIKIETDSYPPEVVTNQQIVDFDMRENFGMWLDTIEVKSVKVEESKGG